MNADVFSSTPPGRPVVLIDLVETKTAEASRAFATRLTEVAEAAGGHRVLANEVILPMVVSDESASKSDRATRLLVVTRYPTKKSGAIALARRNEGRLELEAAPIRTYTARPAAGIESVMERILPSALGLLGRQRVPEIDDAAKLESLIEAAQILDDRQDIGIYEGRWAELVERAGDRPIWMLNFLEFVQTAVYEEDAQDVAPSAPISGARAYQRYGSGMIGSLGAVGGRVGWSSRSIGQGPGTDDGKWHQVVIAVYPSPVAMLTMLALPKYRAAHVHRLAALARTRLLATQPIGDL